MTDDDDRSPMTKKIKNPDPGSEKNLIFFMPRFQDGRINWNIRYSVADILHKRGTVTYYVAHPVTSKFRKGVRHEPPKPERLMKLARTMRAIYGPPVKIIRTKEARLLEQK